jgi:hypothetical protein
LHIRQYSSQLAGSKYGIGRLIHLARAEPVAVAKHGRSVVVDIDASEYIE